MGSFRNCYLQKYVYFKNRFLDSSFDVTNLLYMKTSQNRPLIQCIVLYFADMGRAVVVQVYPLQGTTLSPNISSICDDIIASTIATVQSSSRKDEI